MMPHVFNDGGRAAAGYKGTARDCVTRSIAIAAELPYQQVYDSLAAFPRRTTKKASPRTGVHTNTVWFKEYMRGIGWQWTVTMGIGTGCKVHLIPGELPPGRLIVAVSRHYTAVIDGVIHDNHNPSERGCTIYPLHTPPEKLPKGARLLENGNGYAYEPGRCVYGYWSRKI